MITKSYKGHRKRNRLVLACKNYEPPQEYGLQQECHPLKHYVHHSPDGFEWGYGGSGPSELARCILWDFLGHEPPTPVYQAFKWDIIAYLTEDNWEIDEELIKEWLKENYPELVERQESV